MRQSSNLDPAALDRLERLGGPEFVGKMVTLFLEYAGSKVAEARAACDGGNMEGLGRAVHPIKSSAGNVGATRVQELASEVEILAKQADRTPADAALRELEHAFEAIKSELLHMMNPSGPLSIRKESL